MQSLYLDYRSMKLLVPNSMECLEVRSCAGCRVVLHTQTAVMDLNGVSSAVQAPLGRSGIELQLLSIIVATAALQRGQDRKYILHSMGSWEDQLPYIVCSKDGQLSITAPTLNGTTCLSCAFS